MDKQCLRPWYKRKSQNIPTTTVRPSSTGICVSLYCSVCAATVVEMGSFVEAGWDRTMGSSAPEKHSFILQKKVSCHTSIWYYRKPDLQIIKLALRPDLLSICT